MLYRPSSIKAISAQLEIKKKVQILTQATCTPRSAESKDYWEHSGMILV